MRRALILLAIAVALLAQKGDAQQLTLAWDPSPAVEAVFTRIYARTSAGVQVVGEVAVPQTSQVLNVEYDVPYEFWATSLDITGLEGPASNSVFGRVDAPPPPPLPPSPDGTVSTTIVDCSSGIWTVGSNGETLRNGLHAGGGYGTPYKLLACVVWVKGTDATWYWWNGQWNWTGQTWEPGTSPPPPPPPAGCLTNGALAPIGSRLTQTMKNGEADVFIAARRAEGWGLLSRKKVRNLTTVSMECRGL